MSVFSSVLVICGLAWAGVAGAQQVPASGSAVVAAQQGAKAGASSASAGTPSAMLQPGLDGVKQALGGLKVEHWKAPGAVKEETTNNLASIRRDIDTTLPGLLAAADAAPDSVASGLPVFRNIEALYDVVLRVNGVARLAAPGQESAALGDALASLESGRRALGERLQNEAAAEDRQVSDLRVQLKTAAAAPVVAAAPVCPAPPAVVKKKVVRKPAAPPAAKPASN